MVEQFIVIFEGISRSPESCSRRLSELAASILAFFTSVV
jgi:hypothetical protein